jgi:hypothetical protein
MNDTIYFVNYDVIELSNCNSAVEVKVQVYYFLKDGNLNLCTFSVNWSLL